MEHWNKISCASTLLAVTILMTCFIEESAGLFLNNNISETTSAEPHIYLTTPNPIASTNATRIQFHGIQTNVSEKVEEVPTQQIVNSVKGIVSLVLDEHKAHNQTEQKSIEECNEIKIKLRNITPDTSNDIQTRDDHNSNLIQDAKDPSLSIVKIPDADTEDIATALEDNIRSSVNDEIQIEQNNESSAIDVIEDIPELEVRQKLTEDLMAIEYPQTVRKAEENPEDAPAAKEEDKIQSTEAAIEDTTGAPPLDISLASNQTAHTEGISISVDNADLAEVTTTEATFDAEVTTQTIDYFQEITMIPSEEIVHSFESSNLSPELNSARSRQMRGFHKKSESNEIEKEIHDSSEEWKGPDNTTESLFSGSSLNAKSLSSARIVIADDESVALDTSNIEIATTSPNLTTERIISPTRRPSVVTSLATANKEITADPFKPDSTEAIILDGVTESTGKILSEVVVPLGDGDHTVMKKPGVAAELPSLNETAIPIDENSMNPSDKLVLRPDIDPIVSHLLMAPTEGLGIISTVTESSIAANASEVFQNNRNEANSMDKNLLLETEGTINESERRVLENDFKSIDVDPFQSKVSSTTEHGHNKAIEAEDHSNNHESLTIIEQTKTENTLESQFNNVSALEIALPQEYIEFSTEAHNNDATNELDATTNLLLTSKTLSVTDKTVTPIVELKSQDPTFNEISTQKSAYESVTHHHEIITHESSTENPIGRSNDDVTSPAFVKTLIEAAELTTEFARHVESFRSTRDETSAFSDEVVLPAATGRSFNAIIAEGLGKPLPTRSVGDEPSTSSYSSEDKTTTLVVLCSSAAVIFVAFSIAMYLITFQRQHGTLDIEMQEQRCGKDDLEEDEDAETRVTLLNQLPPVDSDENSFD